MTTAHLVGFRLETYNNVPEDHPRRCGFEVEIDAKNERESQLINQALQRFALEVLQIKSARPEVRATEEGR